LSRFWGTLGHSWVNFSGAKSAVKALSFEKTQFT